MVQIIQERREPSFSQRLGGAVQTGLEGFSKIYGQQKENEAIKRLTGQDVSGLSDPFKQKLFEQTLKNQGFQQKIAAQQQAKGAESEAELGGLNEALDWLDENIEYSGENTIPGFKSFTAGGLNRGAVEKREEIDTTGFLAADKVFTHFNKGTISKDKLQVILKDLAPNSKLSERKNKARIASLRRMMKLPSDIPESAFDKIVEREKKGIGKIDKSGKSYMIAPNGQKVLMDEEHQEEALQRGWTEA